VFRIPPPHFPSDDGLVEFTVNAQHALSYDPGCATKVEVHLTFDKELPCLQSGLCDFVEMRYSCPIVPTWNDPLDCVGLGWDNGYRRRYFWTFTAEAPFAVPETFTFRAVEPSFHFGRDFVVNNITVIVHAPAAPSLSGRRFSPTLPVGSKIKLRDDVFIYKGCTMNHDFILVDTCEANPNAPTPLPMRCADELVVEDVAPDYTLIAGDGVEDYVHPLLDIDTDFSRSVNTAMFDILARLSVATIRGCKVMELLRFIRQYAGERATVMVVGGAVRDAILKRPINDIDLAINLPYDALKECITAFFANKQHPVVATAPGVAHPSLACDERRKSFGMMKVVKVDGDPDHLDVGVFKCLDRDGITAAFGFSPIDDALQRDYSINAVYVDVFEASFYDPFGALKHIIGASAERGMQFFPVAKFASPDRQQALLQHDFGGCVRLFKMLTAKKPTERKAPYVIESGKFRYFVPVLQSLLKNMQTCSNAVDAIIRGERVDQASSEHVKRVLSKVATKLFKDDLAQKKEFDDKAKELFAGTNVIAGSASDRACEAARAACFTASVRFWRLLVSVAQNVLTKCDKFSFLADAHIRSALSAIAKLDLSRS
jgi:hypothetical protein